MEKSQNYTESDEEIEKKQKNENMKKNEEIIMKK